MGWTPSLVHLFCDCKSNLMTSPLLLRYDTSRQTFLKTDCSTGGMGYTLMQPDDSPNSLASITHLAVTGQCIFDVSLDGPRLLAVQFGSRYNMSYKRDWGGCMWTMYHCYLSKISLGYPF